MIDYSHLSLVVMIIGPRGAGKTLLMTEKACDLLVRAHLKKHIDGEKQNVWTNYPVGFWLFCPLCQKGIYLNTLPLNMEALIVFDRGYARGWVLIDEIDLWLERQEWAAIAEKLLLVVLQHIRHRELSLAGTIQNIEWLNARADFQTDIVVKCREAAFTPWGREQNIQDLGEVTFLSWMDKSGIMTGYTYEETGMVYNDTFMGKDFWKCYDTKHEFDVLTSKARYQLKVPTRIITVGENGEPIVEFAGDKKEKELLAVADIAYNLQKRGIKEIKKTEFFEKVVQTGIDISQNRVTKYLKTIGILSTGSMNSKYDLEGAA